jgi:filamentous hemagglutinin
LLLRLKSLNFPPLQPDHTGCGGALQLCHIGDPRLYEPATTFHGWLGFSVTTGNHTQLNGGAIASTASAADNHLDTGTLGFSDIVNKADYNVSHTGGGFSSSGSIGGQFAGNMATTLLSGMSSSGHAEGTTQAVVSQGTITVRDRSGQQQDLSGLQRDVTKANDAISPIFDKEKEQNRLQAVQMIGEIGTQVGDIARTEGQLRAIEAGKAELAKNGTKEPEAGASQDEWNRYNKSVENTESYKLTEQQYGTGSDLQRAITAATAAISGLASGNINSSVAGAAAPYIANEIGKYITPNSALAGVMAHAVVNAALARAQGQNALVSATGAAAGEATGILLAQEIYGKRPEALTESERQTISALSTLTAGLAGGLAGNSTGSVVSGAQAGKTTVENNYLSSTEKSRQTYLNNKQNLTPEEQKDKEALNRKDLESDLAAYAACSGKGGDCQVERAKAKAAQDTYFNQTYQNPKEAQAGYQQIQSLLNSTDPNAKEVFNVLEGYTQAFMTFGYTEEEARARAGAYVGSMYIAGGVSAVVTSGALTKQFGKDVAPGAKPGNSTAKPIENAPNSSETYFRVEGGGNGTQTSQNRINVNSDGSVTIIGL